MYETVVLTGDLAPVTTQGVNYSDLGFPVLNESGQVAFRADLTGTGVDGTNDSGIFTARGPLGNALFVRAGDDAPGTPVGVGYSGFSTPVLNEAGQIAFFADLTGSGINTNNDRGLFTSSGPAASSIVAQEGDPAPGTTSGVGYSSLSNFVFNDAGQIAFTARTTNNNVISLFAADGSPNGFTTRAVAIDGDPAPGLAAGVNYGTISLFPSLNTAGQIVYRSTLSGPGIDSTNNGSIWTDVAQPPGNPSPVALFGDAAPDTTPGIIVSRSTSEATINAAGQTAFAARLIGIGVDVSNNAAIFIEGGPSGPGRTLLARSGDPAPGAPLGVNYDSFSNLVLNESGQVAFQANLTGPGIDFSNSTGLFIADRASGGQLIARAGEDAPGTAPDVVFRDFTFSGSFFIPVLNGVGQTAFIANLTGPGVDSTNGQGIWVTDPDGLLTLVIREGDLFDVDDDPLLEDLRTVEDIGIVSFTGNEDGRRSSFNDRGQLAFFASFTDGSEGIFIAAIPEPASLSLLALGIAALTRRPRGDDAPQPSA
ncbi:MAG: choice-of-anchor tandem repeat NxxGxxAF-containing protein [Planctomycetota bacterium]